MLHELGTGFRTHPGFATTTSLHRQILLDHVFLAATMVSVVGKFWQRPREEGRGRW